jgi:transposase-like protein
MTTNRHSLEFQEPALSKVRQRGTRSIQDVAIDLNMSVGTLRKWISKSTKSIKSVAQQRNCQTTYQRNRGVLPSVCSR